MITGFVGVIKKKEIIEIPKNHTMK